MDGRGIPHQCLVTIMRLTAVLLWMVFLAPGAGMDGPFGVLQKFVGYGRTLPQRMETPDGHVIWQTAEGEWFYAPNPFPVVVPVVPIFPGTRAFP